MGSYRAVVILVAMTACSARAIADQPKTVIVQCGEHYRASWLTRFFWGSQWRDLWTTPIEVPVLDLESFDGGLTAHREAGGLQTKNLHFKSGNGRRWVFRGVDKDPTRILEPEVRQSVLGDIAQDLTSTVHPAGALVAAALLETAGVLHATPVLYVMPDDPRLGEFRKGFAGLLGMVEEREERDIPGVDKVLTTHELFARLESRSDEQVDARDYLRIRLMDMLLGDWDRHGDQWRWVRFKQEGGARLWRGVPRDRDQVFSRFTGLMPSVAEYYTKQLTSFSDRYPSCEKVTFSGRYTDRRFLVGLERPEWDAVTADLKAKLTDAAIADAVQHLPKEMYAKAGATMTQALKARRDRLPEAADDFYRLLARDVDVRGTEGPDDAEVRRNADGSVEVSIFPRDERTGQRLGPAFFHRTFKRDETDEIRLYLLGGADRVVFEGPGGKSILVRVIERGSQTQIEDRSGCSGCADIRRDSPPSQDPKVRFETRRDWGNDLYFFPQLSYDSTRGLVFGATATLTDFGFELDPFSDQHTFGAAYSTGTNQPRIGYAGTYRTRSPISVLAFASYSGMDQVNFFGFGNQTPRDSTLDSHNFYMIPQKKVTLRPLIDFALGGPVHARVGALFEYVSSVESAPVIHGQPGFGQTSVLAPEVGLEIDTTTGTAVAERGFKISGVGRYYPKALGLGADFFKVRASASYFIGAHLLTDFVLGLRVAGEKNWGSYPYFEAAYLGGIPYITGFDPGVLTGNLLRGHDLNRYAGDASLVGNVELRIALFSYNSILPMRFGLIGLTDIGRVFFAPETSRKWHNGVGGGLWTTILLAVPGFRIVTTLNTLVVGSDEGTSFYLTSGFGF